MGLGLILLVAPLYFLSIGAKGLYIGELAVSTRKGLRGNFSLFLSAYLFLAGFAGLFFGLIANGDEKNFNFYGLHIGQELAASVFFYSMATGVLSALIAVVAAYTGNSTVSATNQFNIKTRLASIVIASAIGTALYYLYDWLAKMFLW